MDSPADPAVQIRGLNWAYVLMGAADGTLLPFIPLYLFERGLSAPWIGLVIAVAASASLAMGLAWAYLADRRLSPERMVVIASFAAALVALLLPVAGGAASVAVVIVALSLARSPFMLLDPITLRRLRAAPRTDYARIRLRMSAGWAASAVGSGALFQLAGLHLIPFVYAPLSAVVGLWVWHALKPAAAALPGEPAPAAVRVRRVPVALMTFLVSCFLLGASLAATQNFLVLRISFLGGGALLIGAAAAAQALTEIPTMGYTHVLTKRVSHGALFAIGCGIYLATFVAWAFTSDALVAASLKLVVGVAFALTFVAAVMMANDLAPSHLRATGQALMKSVLFGLAPIAGSVGGGLVYGEMGPRVMFLIATGVVGAAGLIALVAVPARRRVSQPSEVPVLTPEAVTPRA
jgi:PPP family 3-phenylpropionic acid transporter